MKCCSVLGSSELPSFSLSKLCIRQVPRLHISISTTCGSTTAKGLYANSSFVLIHYAFGGVRAQAQSVFVLSTSTTGSSRRVPPPRGSRLAPLLQGLPFSVFLSFLYGTRLLLFPRVAADGSGWDPSSLRPHVRRLRRAHLCAGNTSTGAFGRVSRTRLCTSAKPSCCSPLPSAGIASSCSRSAWQVRFTGWPGQVRFFQRLEGEFGDSPGILNHDPLFGF